MMGFRCVLVHISFVMVHVCWNSFRIFIDVNLKSMKRAPKGNFAGSMQVIPFQPPKKHTLRTDNYTYTPNL